MTQVFPGQSRRVTHALALGSALLLSALFSTEASAQALDRTYLVYAMRFERL